MSSTSTWLSNHSRRPAMGLLARSVDELTRARRLQSLMEHVWVGVFVALLLASAAVLLIRVADLPYSPTLAVLGLMATGIGVAAAWARWNRPGDLGVAIQADLKLNLRQQLSTAWEFARDQPGSALSERLAAQAVRARLPARPELVFPLRFNMWGRLIPAAALLLVLSAIVDLPSAATPQPGASDTLLRQEGIRLREYGQAMEARARRGALTRSQQQARQIQRLGSRMESGGLSRRGALSRLQQVSDALEDERRAALEQGAQTRVGPLQVDYMEMEQRSPASTALGGLTAREMLERLRDGELKAADLDALGSNPGALTPLGVPAGDVEQALQEYSQGEQRKLREILEELARKDQALKDAGQLGDARRQVQAAAENLGEPAAHARGEGEDPGQAAAGGEDGEGEVPDLALPQGGQRADPRGGGRAGSRGQADSPGRRGIDIQAPEPAPASALMKPDASYGEGEVFVSQARALPRAGNVATEARELDPRFQSQLEEVLSKEHYPMHQKAFVRRYFLNLNEGSEDMQQ